MKKPPLKRLPQFYNGRKEILDKDCIEFLLLHKFVVEEKLDGTLRREDYKDYTLLLEDMKYVHSVFYNKLPSRFILVDVLDSNGRRFPLKDKIMIAHEHGYGVPASLFEGNHVCNIDSFLRYLTSPEISVYGDEIREGFVIKSELNLSLGAKWSRLDLIGVKRYDFSKLNHIRG